MTKQELQEQLEQERERNNQREAARVARIKKQNESAKERWDTISCRLPKGTRERIQAHGLTANGYINALVLADLDRLDAKEA